MSRIIGNIYIISNSTIGKPGGTDIRLFNILGKILEKFSVNIIFPPEVFSHLEKKHVVKLNGVRETIPFIKTFNYFLGTIFTYIIRFLQNIFFIPKFKHDLIIYSPTDIIVNVFPSIIAVKLNFNSKLICVIPHLIPKLEVRGNNFRNFLSYHLQRFSLELLKKNASLLLVLNHKVKEELLKKGFKCRIEIVGNGVNIKEIQDSLKENRGKKLFEGVFTGRGNYSKGILDLIEIWKEVANRLPKAKLIIIGNNDEEILLKMKKMIEKYNLKQNIRILGYLQRSKMIDYLSKSKVYVFPSHEEGWGISIAEAMACGLPVVAYDLPVYQEIFPKGMIRVEMRNFTVFADKIVELLNDGNKYNKISKDAFALASKFDWDEVGVQEVKLMENLFE